LADLIQNVVAQVYPFVHARQLHLDVELAQDLGTFEIDADKISAVLVNLLTNAIKFTPDGGRIEVVAGLIGPDEAEITIADHGVGMEPRALQHLFQPFFTQFDPSRHSSGDFGFCQRGLGLGLCIAKQFVEMHGGRITAESVEKEGTRVTVCLPRHSRPDPVPLDRSVVTGGGGSLPDGPALPLRTAESTTDRHSIS
jgi:signal transduction histidine kinase